MASILFILFHAGETRALLPSMQYLARHSKANGLCIVPVGQTAAYHLPVILSPWVKTPDFIREGLGQNDAYSMRFDEKHVQQIVQYCEQYQSIVLGVPSKLQEQISKALPTDKQQIIYVDAGCNQEKLKAFSPYADAFILTSEHAYQSAKKIIPKAQIYRGRHGDFDAWQLKYQDCVVMREYILEKLQVSASQKVILWAGG